jgi:hypothetical protein
MRFGSPLLSLMLLPLLCPFLAWSYEDAPQGKPGEYGSSKNVACPIIVRPGIGIGPIELRQDLKQIESTGLELKTVQGSTAHMIAGRYVIQFDEYGKLHYVQAEVGDLPDCVYYGNLKINKSASVRDLMKVFPGCIMPTGLPSTGGTSIKCNGIYIGFGGWGGQQKTPTLKVLNE